MLLVPVMPLTAYIGGESFKILIALFLFLGVLTDIFDGIIARKLGCATDKLRRMDSQTDICFWLAALASIYIVYPTVISGIRVSLTTLIITEIICYSVSLLKFKRETCTHSYLSKLWGLTLFIAFTNMIIAENTGISWNICFIVGIASQVEVIAILLILPEWRRDIKSSYSAWKIRRSYIDTK